MHRKKLAEFAQKLVEIAKISGSDAFNQHSCTVSGILSE